MTRKPVLILAGPTASGKSALALAVAEQLGGVIINADSMQLYAEARIVTARPDGAALARAPHRLYGCIAATHAASAASWRKLALDEIDQTADRLPILVGGTGLYLKALLRGLVDLPEVPSEIRAAATQRRAELGPEAFHREVAGFDSASAARLPPGDTQRLIRAWELFHATGRPFSAWLATPTEDAPAHLVFHSVILEPARAELYRQIDRRVVAMVEDGVLDEVQGLSRLPAAAPILKAVGVPEFLAHLRGETDLSTAIAAAQQSTRHYAKRQTTWFRHQIPESTRITQYNYQKQPEICSFIRKMLLTDPE